MGLQRSCHDGLVSMASASATLGSKEEKEEWDGVGKSAMGFALRPLPAYFTSFMPMPLACPALNFKRLESAVLSGLVGKVWNMNFICPFSCECHHPI